MKKKVYFSIIFPTNNRASDVDDTLKNLKKSTFKNFEVVIVDNNSSDQTYKIVKKYKFVKYIRNNYNAYVVGARNQAIKHAEGEIIFCIDDDSFPSIHSLKNAYEVFKNNKTVGIISCGIKNYNIYKKEIAKKIVNKKTKGSKETLTWSGCGGFIRKDLYKKYGPWDESGVHGFYESLTCLWALKDKKKIMHYDNIFVFHKVSKSGRGGEIRGNDLMRSDEFFANSFFILKYYGLSKLIKNMSDIFYVISCATIEQKTYIYLKSYFKIIINLNNILKERKVFSNTITDKIRLSFNFIGK
tara:strand:- start:310 stop:1206 length:897 start_codon:yes stop_codon:yes gene_type:complete